MQERRGGGGASGDETLEDRIGPKYQACWIPEAPYSERLETFNSLYRVTMRDETEAFKQLQRKGDSCNQGGTIASIERK